MSMTTRRERREQRLRERRAGGAAAKRTTRGTSPLIPAVVIVVVIAALIAGGRALGVFGPAAAPVTPLSVAKYDVAGETIGTHEADEGNAHVPAGLKTTFKTDPPTSGTHWNQAGVAPVPWGIKDVTLPNEAIVHNLEHGGIVVFYKDLAPDETAKLKELVHLMTQNGFPKIVLEPYPTMSDARIALSAWRWSLKLPSYDDVQIVKFVKSHYESPEAPEPTVM